MPATGPQTAAAQQLHAIKYRNDGESFDDYAVRYARTTADDEKHFRHLLSGTREQRILPGGRQQQAVGSPWQTTASNCYTGALIEDSMRGICEEFSNTMLTLRAGGGWGNNFSTLRPEGEPVRGLGFRAYASGPVSFMNWWDSGCKTIRTAGHRRGALMGILDVIHPDIMKFIGAKRTPGALESFNLSVNCTDVFMEAVYADKLYDLTFDGRTCSRVRAADVWARIMESNWDWAEPGVVFLDRVNRMNPLRYCETIYSCNPCFTGDTRVWTDAGPRRFDELAAAAADVNVLTQADDGRLVYRTMRGPRKTRRAAPLVAVTLDNGAKVRCTPTHEFFLKDGRKVAAEDLRPGDRIESVYRSRANQKGYLRLTNGHHRPLEHHVPFEDGVPAGCEVHHINDDKSDNRIANLELKSGTEHRRHHMTGDRNPLRRFPERNPMHLYPDCTLGSKNGRWRDDLDENLMRRMRRAGKSVEQIARVAGCSKYTVVKRLGEFVRARRTRKTNHRVVGVERLAVREDVYCGTVDETHRFFVQLGDNDGVLVANCGEQFLPPHGACLLGSLNLVKYLVPHYARAARGGDGATLRTSYELDMDLFRADVRAAVRAFDNVIDRSSYPLPQQAEEARRKRRMGLGLTGLANALEVCGCRYGTPEYIAAQDQVLEVLRDTAYLTSVELAREKGPFPLFDAAQWLDGGFSRTLPDEIRDQIRRHGLRNGLLLSLAPCGTISQAADNVSSGIEPPPFIESDRTIDLPDGKVTVPLVDYAYETYGVRGLTASEVPGEAHVAVLCAAQKYVDNACSKTINFKGARGGAAAGTDEVTFDQFKDLYRLAHDGGAKGCTTYNINGKRGAVIRERKAQRAEFVGKAEPEAACEFDPVTGAKSCGD